MCSLIQHTFCMAQMARTSFPILDVIVNELQELKEEVKELKGGKELAIPVLNNEKPTHKEGVGADNRTPITKK